MGRALVFFAAFFAAIVVPQIVFHGLNQCSCDACSAQNASGSLAARSYQLRSLTIALPRNASLGGNLRFSCSRASISVMAIN